uniref:CASP-like protein n=1 Tax=Aegilops tauschii subsp. strangulata TaxID=200361 RepID=A0A453MUW3_AEGTS
FDLHPRSTEPWLPSNQSYMGGGSNSGKVGASEALSLVFRIATVGLSLASAITTAASTQSQCVHEDCNGEATATVSFGNYNSFK